MTFRSEHVHPVAPDPETLRIENDEYKAAHHLEAMEQASTASRVGGPAGACSTASHTAVGGNDSSIDEGATVRSGVGGAPSLPEQVDQIALYLRDHLDVLSAAGMHRQRLAAYRLAYDIETEQRHLNSGGAA